MANWKKLAVYEDNGNIIDGNISGVAHGGFSESPLPISKGGTGVNTTAWEEGSMPAFNGASGFNAVPAPTAPNQLLVSSTGAPFWSWRNVSDIHHHDSRYFKLADANVQTPGNMHILGSLVADSIQVADFEQTTTGSTGAVALNVTGGSANGNNCGMFCDINGNGTLEAGDPAFLWNHSRSRFQAGTYGGNMRDVVVRISGDIDPDSTTPVDASVGFDNGDIYFGIPS
jgi:hypothetical protein